MRDNNFDITRLIAAFLVFFSHSFQLIGLQAPLFLSLHGLHSLGVYIFFIISGYLIAESWDRDPNLLRFFIKRWLRIFPALIAFVLLATFILGPFLTTLPITQYLRMNIRIFINNISLGPVVLPGVFDNLTYPMVNGSLWTLRFEFVMYLMLGFCNFITSSTKFLYVLLFIIFLFLYVFLVKHTEPIVLFYGFDLRYIIILGTSFWSGAVFYVFDLKRYLSIANVILVVVMLLSLEKYPYILDIALYILLPYIVLGFALSPKINISKYITKHGDFSYGFYIYSFPVQQLVLTLKPNIGIVLYLFICTLLTIPFAFLSWKIIEKPFMRLKPLKENNLFDWFMIKKLFSIVIKP